MRSGSRPRAVRLLLDPAFGLFVWAGHLIVIYVANAVFCVLVAPSADSRAARSHVFALAAITIVAAAVVGIHGLTRYRRQPETHNHGFLIRMAVGQDALAVLAILWQLVPIFMSPVCR